MLGCCRSDSTSPASSDDLQTQIESLVSQHGKVACQDALDRVHSKPITTPTPTKEDTAETIKDKTDPSTSESLTDALLDASFDACFVTDSRGNILRANQSSLQLFGYDDIASELVGRNISAVIGGPHAATHYLHFEEQKDGKMPHLDRILNTMRDVLGKRKDGTEFPVQVGIRSMGEGDNRQYVAFCHNLSRHKDMLQQIQEEAIKMKEQLALLDGIFDACFDSIILIDRQGTITKVNQAALVEFGFDKDDLVGQNIKNLVGGGESDYHDGYIQNFHKLGRESSVLGKIRRLTAKRKDGSEFACNIGIKNIASSNDDITVGFVRNISKEVEATEKLEKQLALLDGVLDACFDAIILTDARGTISRVNRGAIAEFGYERAEELVGQNVSKLVGGGHAENHDEYMAAFHRKGKQSTLLGTMRRLSARRKDGSEFPCQIGVRCVEDGASENEEPSMVGFVRDISKEIKAMELAIEKRAAEELLLNMLPAPVAARLKDNPGHIADHFATATVLFADIVGFTKMSSTLEPVEVVTLLNDLFSSFDERLDKYGLNKVKTIGDCYMVTSIPSNRNPHDACAAVCHFGLDLLDELAEYNQKKNSSGNPLNVRVGINTGSVVAGVVGTKRFLYDIWGHAVNLASRMESTGVSGKIQITGNVVDFLDSDEFQVEKRGVVDVKGVGETETFFLQGRTASMSRQETRTELGAEDPRAERSFSSESFRSIGEMLNYVQNTEMPEGTLLVEGRTSLHGKSVGAFGSQEGSDFFKTSKHESDPKIPPIIEAPSADSREEPAEQENPET